MKYGEPRYTKDLDVWVRNSAQNSIRVVAALNEWRQPVTGTLVSRARTLVWVALHIPTLAWVRSYSCVSSPSVIEDTNFTW